MTAEPTHSYETWTPRQAERALSKNKVNRNIREANVDKYARDMENGKWNLGAPIMFDVNGNLLDGQHRLHAQVQADVKIKWLVVRNLPEETQTTIDVGATRNLGDFLAFSGEKYSHMLAPTVRMVTLLEAGKLGVGRWYPTIEEALDTLEKHPELKISVELAAQYRSQTLTPLNQTVMAVAHWMIGQANGYEEADQFIYRMVHLTGERPGSPVLALARRVNEARRQGLRVRPWVYLSLVLKAWNYDADNKTVNKLALYPKGDFLIPEIKKREVPWQALDLDSDEDEVETEVSKDGG